MKLMESEKKIYFCIRCGDCCRWPGFVHISGDEIDRMAAYLEIPIEDFIDEYTRLANGRGLSLTEKADGSCALLAANGDCRVYPERPLQCRQFPNEWNFPGFEAECPAIPRS